MSKGPKSKDEIARNMSAIRSRDNITEVALRKRLFALGLRFRVHPKHVLGKPDISFPRARVAVFVDGDFWHARVLREGGMDALQKRLKQASSEYWVTKFSRRVVRDDDVTASLTYQGWKVIRFWESDIRRNVEAAASQVAVVVRERMQQL